MPMYQPASHARTAGGYGRVNGGPPRMRRDGVRVEASMGISCVLLSHTHDPYLPAPTLDQARTGWSRASCRRTGEAGGTSPLCRAEARIYAAVAIPSPQKWAQGVPTSSSR
jgi:hypothetical protein